MGRVIVVVWSGSEDATEMRIRSGMRKKGRELEHMKRLVFLSRQSQVNKRRRHNHKIGYDTEGKLVK